jgi:hypothetical protein
MGSQPLWENACVWFQEVNECHYLLLPQSIVQSYLVAVKLMATGVGGGKDKIPCGNSWFKHRDFCLTMPWSEASLRGILVSWTLESNQSFGALMYVGPHWVLEWLTAVDETVPSGQISLDVSVKYVNPLNAKLNPIYHLLALLGAHHILHVSR